MQTTLDTKNYYRLPWSLNDNILGWLEPTKRCNLYCEGCYSRNDPRSDKSLEQVRSDMDVFTRNRRMDSISIAGGDPLVHPQIVDIVRMIRDEYGLKPILNTNGLALTPELLGRLKQAGARGFTFHIDSSQGRPGWKRTNELELNALRLRYARMVADAGDMSVNFNSTVFRHTMQYVPDMMDWARDHIDIVAGMVFILFRTSRASEYQYFANGEPAQLDDLVYHGQDRNPEPLRADDLVQLIRQREPEFEPCAYLGGTKDPQSFKWMISNRVGSRGKIHGYLGPRYMELVQQTHHLLYRRYLGYTRPSLLGHGRSASLAFAPFDKGARRVAGSLARSLLADPLAFVERQHIQSILIIQPIDMQPDGEMNMCDGCPDMTVHNGELVWSCRLEERLEHGCFLTAAPRCGSDKVHLPTVNGCERA